MPSRRRDNLDLAGELSDRALKDVPRDDLLALLRACSIGEVYIPPWDSATVVMSAAMWSRIEATAVRCLEKARLK